MIPGATGRCVLHPSPPPRCGLWAVWTTTTWTGWPAACRPPATGPSWCLRCAGCRRRCLCRGETGGGGREAHGIPGRGENDEYRGRKVQEFAVTFGTGSFSYRLQKLPGFPSTSMVNCAFEIGSKYSTRHVGIVQ